MCCASQVSCELRPAARLNPSTDPAVVLLLCSHECDTKEASTINYSSSLPTSTVVHSIGVFSPRLNYFSLLGINIFYVGMISLLNGLVNSRDGVNFSHGWSFKTKNIQITLGHPYLFSHYSPEIIANDLMERFPKGLGMHIYLLYCILRLPRCLLPQATFPLKNHTVKALVIL